MDGMGTAGWGTLNSKLSQWAEHPRQIHSLLCSCSLASADMLAFVLSMMKPKTPAASKHVTHCRRSPRHTLS